METWISPRVCEQDLWDWKQVRNSSCSPWNWAGDVGPPPCGIQTSTPAESERFSGPRVPLTRGRPSWWAPGASVLRHFHRFFFSNAYPKIKQHWDLVNHPVVKTPTFHRVGRRFNSWLGSLRFHMMRGMAKKKKKNLKQNKIRGRFLTVSLTRGQSHWTKGCPPGKFKICACCNTQIRQFWPS